MTIKPFQAGDFGGDNGDVPVYCFQISSIFSNNFYLSTKGRTAYNQSFKNGFPFLIFKIIFASGKGGRASVATTSRGLRINRIWTWLILDNQSRTSKITENRETKEQNKKSDFEKKQMSEFGEKFHIFKLF